VHPRGPFRVCPQETLLEAGAQADDRADEVPVFARGLEGFAPLAERSRYAIAESYAAVVSEQVLLRLRATVPPSQ
jgi:hypothetical protein